MANRKGEIIDAAIRRIADHGHSFTAGQIASDLKCSQSLIFRYYQSKEGLQSACFDSVCHELKLILKRVEVPSELTRESIGAYMVDVWKAYCAYLESNTHIARAYMYFVSTGRKYPRGYKTAESVLRSILGDDYYRILEVCPDFPYVADFIIVMSNAVATGKFVDWKSNPGAADVLDSILIYGVLGRDGRNADEERGCASSARSGSRLRTDGLRSPVFHAGSERC